MHAQICVHSPERYTLTDKHNIHTYTCTHMGMQVHAHRPTGTHIGMHTHAHRRKLEQAFSLSILIVSRRDRIFKVLPGRKS